MNFKKTAVRGNPGIDLTKLPPLTVLEALDPSLTETRTVRQPLHTRVRHVLTKAIDEHFEHGQTFWTEQMLMDRIGVSRITVRQALADLAREGLLIRQAAKGSIVCKETSVTTLGVFVTEDDLDRTAGLLRELSSVARGRGHHLQIYPVRPGEALEVTLHALIRSPREERIVILMAPHEKLRSALISRGYRYVVIDRMGEGYTGPFVGIDNDSGIVLGLDHLIALGHRRITLLVNEPATTLSVQERICAFGTHLAYHGITEGKIVDCGTRSRENSFDKTLQAMPTVWAQEVKPTAILTVSAPGAWAALQWFRQNGVSVPDQVSVVAFEDATSCCYTIPSLTTIDPPLPELARHAVDLLWSTAEKAQQFYLSPTLAIHESTAATY